MDNPSLILAIHDLPTQAPVTAFYWRQTTLYVLQPDEQDALITACAVDEAAQVATAQPETTMRVTGIGEVHTLEGIETATQPQFWLGIGQPDADEPKATYSTELGLLTFEAGATVTGNTLPRLTELTAANITGTPMHQPLLKTEAALSSDEQELLIMGLDTDFNAQLTIYDQPALLHLLETNTSETTPTLAADDLRVMKTVIQSFKPADNPLDFTTDTLIQSVDFSNGRAIYATRNAAGMAVGKGYWLLKAGFAFQPMITSDQEATVTDIQLKGKNVLFNQYTPATGNQLFAVPKQLWDK